MKNLMWALLAVLPARAEDLVTADLAKLRDPVQREDEVKRLAGITDSWKLTGFRFLTAQQRSGPPLHVLSASRDYAASASSLLLKGYEVGNPEELFTTAKSSPPFQSEANLDPVRDGVLLIFNSEGREIRPFGGDNFTDFGYFYDFDRDGILDRAEATHYGLDQEAPDTDITMFELQSVETEPRSLLRVVINWHPDSADKANEWDFACEDVDRDGYPEIIFGPRNTPGDASPERIVFRWDPGARAFRAGELPAKSHVRVLKPGESLKTIARSGGLGYPLVGEPSDSAAGNSAAPAAPPYVFQSLKNRSDAELAAFFQGRKRRDSFEGPEGSFPNTLPAGLAGMEPKKAALALAEANRMADHKQRYQIALDDRGGIRPPASGWLVSDWDSSACYSFSSQLTALRFGVPDPVLLVFDYNRIGAVGRNPWADQPAHGVRLIPLRPEEARFIADTIFWLDRLRSFTAGKGEGALNHWSSTADGRATISLYPDGGNPVEIGSETVWATRTLSAGWRENYTKEVFVNLARFFITDGIPQTLGGRWSGDSDVGWQNLTTPTDERLAPRVDDGTRRKLGESVATILERNTKDPAPARVLAKLALAASDEALTGLLPALREINATLPLENAEDREFAELEKRVSKGLLPSLTEESPAEEEKARDRYLKLADKRRFLPAAILREPLAAAVSRLAAVENRPDLERVAAGDSREAVWALQQLHRIAPDAWGRIVSSRFPQEDLDSRRVILETLAAGYPPAATDIIGTLSHDQKLDLVSEIAAFHRKDAAALERDRPLLMQVVRDRKRDYIRRSEAMDLLAGGGLTGDDLKTFAGLVMEEIRNPQIGKYGLGSLSSAVRAFGSLPREVVQVDLLVNEPQVSAEAFGEGVESIARLTDASPARDALLASFIRPRFETSTGMMNDLFMTVLAFDLRELKDGIAAFATASPDTPDGDAAEYSGGSFEGPAGQRYHLAREITALWAESDPQTLGRMWTFLIAAHAGHFNPEESDSRTARALREHAANRIRALDPDGRMAAIQRTLEEMPIPSYYAGAEKWLRSLADHSH